MRIKTTIRSHALNLLMHLVAHSHSRRFMHISSLCSWKLVHELPDRKHLGMDHRMTSPVHEEPRPTSPFGRPTSPQQGGCVVSPPPRGGGRVVSPPRARVVSPTPATQRSRMANPTLGSSSPRRPSRLTRYGEGLSDEDSRNCVRSGFESL